jgi:hypothetical protein
MGIPGHRDALLLHVLCSGVDGTEVQEAWQTIDIRSTSAAGVSHPDAIHVHRPHSML